MHDLTCIQKVANCLVMNLAFIVMPVCEYPNDPVGIAAIRTGPVRVSSSYNNYVLATTCRRIWSLVRTYVNLIALKLRLAPLFAHGFETSETLLQNPVLR
jgi:hypothetical protein